MSNILLGLGIRAPVLSYFLPYLKTLTENAVAFPYHDDSGSLHLEIFREWGHTIPAGRLAWTVYPRFSPTVRHHFLFYSALESLCFFSLHPRWLHCPSSVAVSALGLCPEPSYVVRLLTALPNAKLHFAFGNDLPARVMDCQIPLWLSRKDWHFSYQHGHVHITNGIQAFSIEVEDFSCKGILGHRINRRFKKERPKGGCASFYEQLRYP